jgi:hypothetical protein
MHLASFPAANQPSYFLAKGFSLKNNTAAGRYGMFPAGRTPGLAQGPPFASVARRRKFSGIRILSFYINELSPLSESKFPVSSKKITRKILWIYDVSWQKS